jgi:hypothetical protein
MIEGSLKPEFVGDPYNGVREPYFDGEKIAEL